VVELEFLCLGVLRHFRGYHAVGVDSANGKWVRLVGPRYSCELSLGHLKVEGLGESRRMRPLDVALVPVGGGTSKMHQPENWVLEREGTDKPMRLLKNAAQEKSLVGMIMDLAQASSKADLLFDSVGTTNPADEAERMKGSLFVVHSKHLMWTKTDEFHKGRSPELGQGPFLKGCFDFGEYQTRYCLPVSDATFEREFGANIPSERFIDDSKLRSSTGPTPSPCTLLTVSYDDNLIKVGQRYKFIAGVMALPEL